MKQKKQTRGSKESQETQRILVIDYLKKKRETHRQAAELFGLTKSAVDKIWTRYKQGGTKGLQSKKRGANDGIKLKNTQTAEVRRQIKGKCPDQLKLSFGLWTREAAQQLIARLYGVELSVKQVGRYLKRWGYMPQKPIRKAFEQKPKAVMHWLEEEYPAIKKRAAKEKAVIYFGDETGMRSDNQAGRSYAPKGQTLVVKAAGKRFSLNMISAISNKGYLQFMLISSFNSEVFKDFLERMTRYSREKIFFITDNHPSHKSKVLNEWLEQNKQKIEVFFLPPYSSELNPQE
ncbi:MAG: IS630 family transposase [Chitinophagaceae bacterium]|jgi:transposase|nr:IS630 family transposase [Chitinophagaceae bacterium]